MQGILARNLSGDVMRSFKMKRLRSELLTKYHVLHSGLYSRKDADVFSENVFNRRIVCEISLYSKNNKLTGDLKSMRGVRQDSFVRPYVRTAISDFIQPKNTNKSGVAFSKKHLSIDSSLYKVIKFHRYVDIHNSNSDIPNKIINVGSLVSKEKNHQNSRLCMKITEKIVIFINLASLMA